MHKLIVSMRQAPDVVLALSNELSDLALVLLEIKTTVHDNANLPPESRERLAILLSRVQPKVNDIESLASRLSEAGSSSTFLKLGRLAWIDGKAKANVLQKDLRIIRLNISAILAANSTSGVLRLEVALNNLKIVTQQAQHQQTELQTSNLKEVTRHSGLLESFLTHVGPLMERHEQVSQQLENVGRLYSELPKREKGPSEAPPAYSALDPYGLQVVGYRHTPCSAGCPCRCHNRNHHSSPPILSKFLGTLFIGYSSSIVSKPRCDSPSCHRPSKLSVQLIYCFPAWFLNRALIMAISQGSFDSIQASISLHKIVPQTADRCLRFLCVRRCRWHPCAVQTWQGFSP
ncbi:hypothetical protein BKA65DRAFT_207463 [Rhexocercosporidium sp. MPI-PUGE-AT-0058]|nr:hypothetical protein BKA65DRAFT_207463 [Rhexocercosporidium sp. MPI-PUGE-AT-0058]